MPRLDLVIPTLQDWLEAARWRLAASIEPLPPTHPRAVSRAVRRLDDPTVVLVRHDGERFKVSCDGITLHYGFPSLTLTAWGLREFVAGRNHWMQETPEDK
jgi:hypothetical protein